MKQLGVSAATAIVKIIVAYFIIRYVIKAAATAYDFGNRIFTEEPVSEPPGITYTVNLTEETTPKQVAEALEDYGLVRDKNLFYVQYLLSSYKDELTPGSYDLNTAMTAEEMLAVMAARGSGEDTEDVDDSTSEEKPVSTEDLEDIEDPVSTEDLEDIDEPTSEEPEEE